MAIIDLTSKRGKRAVVRNGRQTWVIVVVVVVVPQKRRRLDVIDAAAGRIIPTRVSQRATPAAARPGRTGRAAEALFAAAPTAVHDVLLFDCLPLSERRPFGRVSAEEEPEADGGAAVGVRAVPARRGDT